MAEPRLARLLSSYQMCRHLNCLPGDGGLSDQDAEWVAFAGVFAATEVEYEESQRRKRR